MNTFSYKEFCGPLPRLLVSNKQTQSYVTPICGSQQASQATVSLSRVAIRGVGWKILRFTHTTHTLWVHFGCCPPVRVVSKRKKTNTGKILEPAKKKKKKKSGNFKLSCVSAPGDIIGSCGKRK